jgi:hypothetical protein
MRSGLISGAKSSRATPLADSTNSLSLQHQTGSSCVHEPIMLSQAISNALDITRSHYTFYIYPSRSWQEL